MTEEIFKHEFVSEIPIRRFLKNDYKRAAKVASKGRGGGGATLVVCCNSYNAICLHSIAFTKTNVFRLIFHKNKSVFLNLN